jgi:HPr kinase/phosphorylase
MAQLAVNAIISNFSLKNLNTGNSERTVLVPDINRPGLILAGYAEYFDKNRIQVMGNSEMSYLNSLDRDLALKRWCELMDMAFPCLVVTRRITVPESWLDYAAMKGLPVLGTDLPTSRFMAQLTDFLEQKLAPTTTIHAVLVDVHGVGTLITGDSGIGKSETALELIKRGHRLVADDAVEISRCGEDILIGTAPEILRHVMEVRGLGILNVNALFGIGAVRPNTKIHIIIHLQEWRQGQQYDRLGLDEETQDILGVQIPKKTIPVQPGRNLASIVEVAAMNYRLHQLGYHSAKEFVARQNDFCATHENG